MEKYRSSDGCGPGGSGSGNAGRNPESTERVFRREDAENLLNLAVEMGYLLMSSGAEIYRVEESVARLLRAWELDTAEVFAIPSCLIVSAVLPDGHSVTRMRRIPAHGTDVELLERCNALCRQLCAEPPSVEEARRRVSSLTEKLPRYHSEQVLLGYAVVPAFFAPLFGGDWEDALCAMLGGLMIGILLLYGRKFTGSNSFFRTAVCAASSSLSSLLLVRLGMGHHVDAVTISILMLLVPGMALTNAMREIMAGDTISGLTRFADVLLMAGAIALGAAAGLAIGQLPGLSGL